jgi:membrane protein YdbS with pleckstrin-like domain
VKKRERNKKNTLMQYVIPLVIGMQYVIVIVIRILSYYLQTSKRGIGFVVAVVVVAAVATVAAAAAICLFVIGIFPLPSIF